MTYVLLITEADGSASWAKIPYGYSYGRQSYTLQRAWEHVRRGYTLRCNSVRPVNAYALQDNDWGLDVVFNPDYVRSIAAFPIF